MSKQTPLSLSGYLGMEPAFTLADGRIISAGELIADHALPLYHELNPGLDASQLPAAWNALTDVERNGYCIQAFDKLDASVEDSANYDDRRALLAQVAPKAELVLGDGIMDAVLQTLRRLRAPWTTLREDEQDELLEFATERVRAVAKETVRQLATRGTHHIVATLDQVTIKKGAKLVLSIQSSQVDEHLTESVQQQVILVLAGALDEAEEIQQPAADPQQPGLQLDESNGAQHSDPED